jgi:hypothetical protein
MEVMPEVPVHPVTVSTIGDSMANICSLSAPVGTWQDSDLSRPIAAPLERCAELLGVDLATVREVAAKVEPYVRADGATIVDVRVRVEQPAPPLPLSTRRR